MKYEEIHALLDRYWEGETTLEEERQIKAYFASGTADARLAQFAPLFRAIREEQDLQLKTGAKKTPMRPVLYQWAAAASVALMLGAGWWMMRHDTPAQSPVAEVAPVPEDVQPTTPPVKAAEPVETLAATLDTPEGPSAPAKRKTPRKTAKQTEVDPETAKAMAEIKAALALVSSKLDKGRNKAIESAGHLEALDKLPRREEG